MIEIRALASHQELSEAVRLQKEIWGFEELELLPVRLFVVATKIGGQVFGAYDGLQMVGFLLAIPGLKPGGMPYLHSHMMGVLPPYQNKGVGRLLKLQQRTLALQDGLRLIEWTFDPLEIKNAFFNIERLGAVVRRYVLNQYGTTTSHLHSGLPTDRCVAEWPIASGRVALTLQTEKPHIDIEQSIEVPVDIADLRVSDPDRARHIQARISREFLAAFDEGLTVVGFERGKVAGKYLLGRWQSE